MDKLEIHEIVGLLRRKLKPIGDDKIIIIAKDWDQLQVALEEGTLGLIPKCNIIEGLHFLIYVPK